MGNFDGVHLGHQQILTASRQAAAERDTQLVVMTFEPHPLRVVRPDNAPGILTPLNLKEHLLARFGADCLLVLQSTPELLELSPEGFVCRFLVEKISPSLVIEGGSFNFGSRRSGTVETLRDLGIRYGFDVSVIEAENVRISAGRKAKVSSTLIRDILKDGNVSEAATAMGRPYRLIEKIIPGRGIGKSLGFATANMRMPKQVIPAEGVYAGLVEVAESPRQLYSAKVNTPAALSIGKSATYGDVQSLLIEAHLLKDNVGELHGKYLAMDLIELIRPQRKFNSESDLAAQIAKDCEEAKRILTT